jgi:energy-coupling factor transporter ATPase
MDARPRSVPAVVFDDVTFHYPGGPDAPALEGVSITVGEGELLAVAGLNGSGKSTFCRLVDGLILPARGRVTVAGLDTSSPQDLKEVRRRVGLILQNPDSQIVGPTVEDDVAFGLENLAFPRPEMQSRVEEMLELMGLGDLRRREPHLLSVGEKKRLAVAGALAAEPSILVSDESTSMLDPRTRAEVMQLFFHLRRERGITVIHATHQPEEILAADRVALLAGGRLVFAGRPVDLFQRADFAEEHGITAPDLFLLARELEARGFAMPAGPLLAADIVEGLWASS